MKRTILLMLSALFTVVYLPIPAWAESITWDNIAQLRPFIIPPETSAENYFYADGAQNNIVTVDGSPVLNGHVSGAIANSGDVVGNKVIIGSNAQISNGTYGNSELFGAITMSGNAVGNSIEITDTQFSSSDDIDITGGATLLGDAVGNTVYLSGVTTGQRISIVGGHTEKGNAVNNNIIINSSKVNTDPVAAGYTKDGNATGNSVSITNGDISVDVYGGHTEKGNAQDNTVEINGGTVNGNVYGGFVLGNGSASGNSVGIAGGTVTGNVYGGYAAQGNSQGNTVEINGGTITGDVYGGWGHKDGGYARVTDNTVIIRGGTIVGSVYAGWVDSDATDVVANNTVIVYGGDLSQADLFTFGKGNITTQSFGNTLIIQTDGTSKIRSISGFEAFGTVLPSNVSNGYTVVEAGAVIMGDGVTKPLTISSIEQRGGGTPMAVGTSINLIKTTTSLAGEYTPGVLTNQRRGIALLQDWRIERQGDNLSATMTGRRVNPQTKALSEGRVAGAAFLNQGGDLLAYQGIGAAQAAANAKLGLSSFVVTSGGWSRFNTGSHVDVSGVSLLAGMAIGGNTPIGRMTGGGFFESGWGNYDTYNSFDIRSSVKGGGDTSYVGGGVFGRLDVPDTGPGHFYGELSGRAGSQYSDFSSGDLRDPNDPDRKARYDMEGAYYGLHTGLGYMWNIAEAASLDLSARYFWTHQEGGSVRVINDRFTFDDVDSHRVRTGGRVSLAVNEHVKPYIGAAYEYEFSGEAKAKTNGLSVDAPDLTGSTGIGEIGVNLIGGDKAPVSLDLGAQGYTGLRQGVTGSLQLKLEF
jgi:hypothetical protein